MWSPIEAGVPEVKEQELLNKRSNQVRVCPSQGKKGEWVGQLATTFYRIQGWLQASKETVAAAMVFAPSHKKRDRSQEQHVSN
jgi:hypothetical protein